MQQQIVIIAGPNGAGKTTFARSFLLNEADCPNFVNADLIAAGLSPFNPDAAAIRAGRLMLAEIRRLAGQRISFAFETTLSGRTYAALIPKWREDGYRVDLLFLKLVSIRLAEARVRDRVLQGGHSIPSEIIRRRFESGWRNFESIYKPLVNHWRLYDNSFEAPVLLEAGENP
jgi:predicted ABC-type ATPase